MAGNLLWNQGTPYTGTKANNPPNWTFHNRAPTQYDVLNFALGDLWLDMSASPMPDPYVLVKMAGTSSSRGELATWLPFGGGNGTVSSFPVDITGTQNPVLPDGSGAVQVTSPDSSILVTGNTASISLQTQNHQAAYTVQTTDATPTTLVAFALLANNGITVTGNIMATQSDYSGALTGGFNAGARRAGAGAIIIGSPIVSYSEDFAGSPTVDVIATGNNIVVQVTGVAATVINWRGLIGYNLQNA